MIGNDVIDLAAARQESNWQRRGVLQKLFTADEQGLIKSHAEPEVMVWTLWSMKEAAYKIYNRETGVRALIPHKLMCSLQDTTGFGSVSVGDDMYYTETLIVEEMIHTVAVKEIEYLLKVRESSFAKSDERGLPYIFNNKNETMLPASKSHHGRYQKTVFLEQ